MDRETPSSTCTVVDEDHYLSQAHTTDGQSSAKLSSERILLTVFMYILSQSVDPLHRRHLPSGRSRAAVMPSLPPFSSLSRYRCRNLQYLSPSRSRSVYLYGMFGQTTRTLTYPNIF